MAKSKPVVINGLEFKTKASAKLHIQEITKKSFGSAISTGDSEWDFLNSLLDRHPECIQKRGVGIQSFKVVRNVYKNLEWKILRTDGSKIDFSWINCLDESHKSPLDNLKDAMRLAIEGQVDEFKEREFFTGMICECCGHTITDLAVTHVDHINFFDLLADGFIALNSDHPLDFDDDKLTNRARFKAVDANYKESWEEFHLEKAELRIIHGKCNLKREKPKS